MIVAQFRVLPLGVGSSMEDAMQEIVRALDATGIHYEVGAVSTTMEADRLETVLDAFRAAHDALVGDVPRIEMELSIDHRLDKEETIESLREEDLFGR